MDSVVLAHLQFLMLFGESEVDLVCCCVLAPSCFVEPPAAMSHEAVQCHRKFQHPEGDHFTLINIYNAYKQNQREQCKTVIEQNQSILFKR